MRRKIIGTLIVVSLTGGCGVDEATLLGEQSYGIEHAPPDSDEPLLLQPGCGNGILEKGEQCEGAIKNAQLGGATCQSLGFTGGVLYCGFPAPPCTYNTSGCYTCGDGTISYLEKCDGTNLGGQTCTLLGYKVGTLKCSSTCTAFDTTSCYGKCGDGRKDGTESCDGADFGGKTCASLGLGGGVLTCTSCSLSTSGCYKCGDGKISGPETCDGTNFGGKTCASFGFGGGTLKCSQCGIDTSGCFHICGDNKIGGSEACDGTNLGGKTCVSIGFTGGTLRCTASCTLDTSDCERKYAFHVNNITSVQLDNLGLPLNWETDTYDLLTCEHLGEGPTMLGLIEIPAGACYKCGHYATTCANKCYSAGYRTQEWVNYQFELCKQDPDCLTAPGPMSTTADAYPTNPPPDIPVVDFTKCLANETFPECYKLKPYCRKCSECRQGCGFWQWLGCIAQGAGCAVSVIGGGVGAVTCPVITAYVCGPCF